MFEVVDSTVDPGWIVRLDGFGPGRESFFMGPPKLVHDSTYLSDAIEGNGDAPEDFMRRFVDPDHP